MKIFSKLFKKVMEWSQHQHAPRYLAGLSFTEASFFPIPPDVLLAPMTLSQPDKAWRYASITVIASVLGGLFGYCLGFYAFDPLVRPLMASLGYTQTYLHALELFNHWGIWVMFLVSFTPIPYKIFTLTAGTAAMPLFPFFIVTLIGRAARFYLVAGLIRWGGPSVEPYIIKYLDRIGWFMLGVGLLLFYIFH